MPIHSSCSSSSWSPGHGDYVITGEVDRSAPGEPVIRVKLEPSTSKGSMPVV